MDLPFLITKTIIDLFPLPECVTAYTVELLDTRGDGWNFFKFFLQNKMKDLKPEDVIMTVKDAP